jgi:hypothetical protein
VSKKISPVLDARLHWYQSPATIANTVTRWETDLESWDWKHITTERKIKDKSCRLWLQMSLIFCLKKKQTHPTKSKSWSIADSPQKPIQQKHMIYIYEYRFSRRQREDCKQELFTYS